jgi:hypothetical protein
MRKEILYTTALNDKGDLVHVDDAIKGNAYFCPGCKGELILRKSGNTAKGSKRPHFAHNNMTQNCSSESVLHYSFKRKLTDLLRTHLSEKKEFFVSWKCSDCSGQHEANLLTKITSVYEEHNLKVCQPDIALLDENEKVTAVIEIVVTHSPEEKVLQFYRENGIILIQINLSSDEDLRNFETIASNPDAFDYCFSPGCSTYERYPIRRRIVSFPGKCNRCFSPIEKFMIKVESAFGVLESSDFLDQEINYVKSMRSNIKIFTDQNTNAKYPISICRSCRRMQLRYGSRRF